MERNVDGQLKDASPLDTVQRIKGILAQHGIETEERWFEATVPYCRALSVSIKGTTFSTNGKGLSREYALASGYGELMERLQLGYVGGKDVQRDGRYAVGGGADVMVPWVELFQRNRGWYQCYAQRLKHYCGVEETPEKILSQYADAEGMVKATPFFSLTRGTTEYFPTAMHRRLYSANGCAAGNSMEEALVQGISEIVERHHHIRVLEEQLTLADIPEEVLERYPIVCDIISFIRSQGYRVVVKDASLGTGFPVVCVCFIDERTGRYHVHFGANPILEIALQRVLTESFQGRTLDRLAAFDDFIYSQDQGFSTAGILNELVKGTWEKRPSFFVGTPKYPYDPNMGFTGKTNRELLKQCVEFFRKIGVELLVRDASCLGFPTYQILAPGYSEVFYHRISSKADDLRYAAHTTKTLRDPAKAGMDNYLGFLFHMLHKDADTSAATGAYSFAAASGLAVDLTPAKDAWLMNATMGYVYYAMQKYPEAIKCIQNLLPQCDKEQQDYLICLKRYLSLGIHKYDAAEIRSILAYFHRPETVASLMGKLKEKRNPLEKFVLHCDKSCTESCLLYGQCCQKKVDGIATLLAEKTRTMDFEAFCDSLKEFA